MLNYEITKSEEIFLFGFFFASTAEDEFLKHRSQGMLPPLFSPHLLPKVKRKDFKCSMQEESEIRDEVNRRECTQNITCKLSILFPATLSAVYYFSICFKRGSL